MRYFDSLRQDRVIHRDHVLRLVRTPNCTKSSGHFTIYQQMQRKSIAKFFSNGLPSDPGISLAAVFVTLHALIAPCSTRSDEDTEEEKALEASTVVSVTSQATPI